MSLSHQITRVMADRTAQTLLLSAVLLACGTGIIRGPAPQEMRDSLVFFDFQKLMQKQSVDVVILGDSRTLVGVSPAVMEASLPDLEIFNFAFAGAGFSTDYLGAADAAWKPDSHHKIAVLGITPRSLRQVSQTDNQFLTCSRSLTQYAWWKSHWSGCIDYLWPTLNRQLFEQLRHANGPDPEPRRHPDGWLEPRSEKMDFSESHRYYERMRHDPIREEVIDRALAKIRTWTEQGITVYAFRPPTCDSMELLEDDFAEPQFAARFESAGGHWLRLGTEGLETYDGSHLDRASSRLLSSRLARQIGNSDRYASRLRDTVPVLR